MQDVTKSLSQALFLMEILEVYSSQQGKQNKEEKYGIEETGIPHRGMAEGILGMM